MERSPIKSCLLAGECGSGKTITVLMHILLEAEKAEKAGLNDHKVTIIFAPSSVVDVWYCDWQKYFRQSLICRLFYGRDSTDSKRERCQIAGNSAEDFDKFLEDCRSDDPRVRQPKNVNEELLTNLRHQERLSSHHIRRGQDELSIK